jgi:predicted transposase YbfD/YdcC
VENSCHWVLDLIMREDDICARSGHTAENLATLRRMAMNLLN